MVNDNEHEKAYPEVINYSIQAMSENAQFSIAIAVGIFGILAIFVSLGTHTGLEPADELTKKALWTQPMWIRITGIVLSIAYWALILFGIQSYLTRRLFEGIVGHYQKKLNEEWYYNDIKKVADEKKIVIGWSKLYGQITTKRKTGIKDYTESWFLMWVLHSFYGCLL